MATRSTRSPARRQAQRRRLVWARSNRGGSPTLLSFTNEANGVLTTVDALEDFETRYSAELIGATIMRIRFGAVFWTDPPVSGAKNSAASWGFVITNDQAAIGSSNPTDLRFIADWSVLIALP